MAFHIEPVAAPHALYPAALTDYGVIIETPLSSQAEAPVPEPLLMENDGMLVDDWLDTAISDDLLEWCVSSHGPSSLSASTPLVLPQSPTGVDCLHLRRGDTAVQDAGIKHESSAYIHRKDTQKDRSSRSKHDAFADAGTLRGQLEHYMRKEDAAIKEKQRVRQRGYEKAYKKRKQGALAVTRTEWAALEIEFYNLLQTNAHAINAGRPTTLHACYLKSLLKARGRRQDNMMLKSILFWKELFALRNYAVTEEELVRGLPPNDEKEEEVVLRTRSQWAAIDKQILGACVIKPFRPVQFQFKWN